LAAIHVAVEGRVQGVGFRWFVRQRAKAGDLAGFVRNLPDGSVEVAAEGDDELVARLRRDLERGPSGARVTAVRELGPLADSLERPFTIQR
jgi:acylphosphatase